jgi:hypothetical protein
VSFGESRSPERPRGVEVGVWIVLAGVVIVALVLVLSLCRTTARSTTNAAVAWGEITLADGTKLRADWCRGSYTGTEVSLLLGDVEVAHFNRDRVTLWRDSRTALPLDKAGCRVFAVNLVVTPASDEDAWPFSDGSVTLACDGARGTIAFKNCH